MSIWKEDSEASETKWVQAQAPIMEDSSIELKKVVRTALALRDSPCSKSLSEAITHRPRLANMALPLIDPSSSLGAGTKVIIECALEDCLYAHYSCGGKMASLNPSFNS